MQKAQEVIKRVHANTGRTWSDEYKALFRQHKLGYKQSKEQIQKAAEGKWKKVYQYTKEGEFVREWSSIKEVAKELNLNTGNISASCNNYRSVLTIGGYRWKFDKYDKLEILEKYCETYPRVPRKYNNEIEGILQYRLEGARTRSKAKNNQCTLTLEYLHELWKKQKGLCAISGILMTYTRNGGRIKTNVSLDRIDSNIGYTKENVQLVCYYVNIMKSNASMKELVYFCKNITEYNK